MLVQVFKNSFEMLLLKPKVFLPRLVTTTLYSFFAVYSAKFSLEIIKALSAETLAAETLGRVPDFGSALAGYESALAAYLLFFLFVYAVDILSYGMYVTIVRDYRARGEISLSAALRNSLQSAKTLFVLSLVVLAFLALCLIIYAALGAAYMRTQSLLFPALTILFLILAIAVFALLFFFLIPAVVAEKRGAASALSRSVAMGMCHKGEVIKTNFFFAALVLATMIVVIATEFKGTLAFGAVAAFIAGRIVQAVVYTYISAVNPAVYFWAEEEGAR